MTFIPPAPTSTTPPAISRKKASCEECGRTFYLTTIDADGILIGDECKCGYYVTRYMPGQEPR